MDKLADDFESVSTFDIKEILNNLLDSKNNLELKTHIEKPRELTSLYTLGHYLEKSGYIKCGTAIKEYIRKYLEYMISYKRLSRKEIIYAITKHIDVLPPEQEPIRKSRLRSNK